MDKRIVEFGLYQSCGNMGSVYVCLSCGGVCGEWVGVGTRVWRGGVVLCLFGLSV